MSVDQYIKHVNRLQLDARSKRRREKLCGTGFRFWLRVYRFRPWPVRILMAVNELIAVNPNKPTLAPNERLKNEPRHTNSLEKIN